MSPLAVKKGSPQVNQTLTIPGVLTSTQNALALSAICRYRNNHKK